MNVGGGAVVFLLLCRVRRTKSNAMMKIVATRERTIVIMTNLCLLFSRCEEHEGKCRSGMPPQSLLLPWIEMAEEFEKTTIIGSSLEKLLNDMFR
jgi:hypothetical protein